MTRLTKLTVLAAAVALSVGLAACGGGGSSTSMTDTSDPPPEPTPDTGVVDLAAAQEAAMAAASAAMAASNDAAASAAGAATATANIATLQTGEMAGAHAMAASSHAATAMAEYMKASAANTAAQAATTGSAAGAQVQIAQTAQAAAEAAAMKAAEYAMKAAEAAMTELHIEGTMKSAAGSSLDATSGTLTSYNDDGDETMVTGFRSNVTRNVAAIAGRAFDDNEDGDATPTDPSDDVTYRQAVAAQAIGIGKVVDSSDDMARLTIVTGRAGSEMVRIFADAGSTLTAFTREALADGTLVDTFGDGTNMGLALKSVGSFHEAVTDAGTPAGSIADALDFTDEIATGSKAVEVFSYVTGEGAAAVTNYVVVESRTTNSDGAVTSMSLQPVDITAAAAVPDSLEDADTDADMARVMAALPSLEPYSHIHFGVWAGLKDNADGDNSAIGDLGIGFVQNYDDSDVTTGHVTGTATYSGDWVAVVRGSHSSSLATENGSAALTANFSEDEFTGALAGLATLEGSLSGNTFSGTDATVEHADMNTSGTFAGSFSGAIYGDDGAEAAGVFSFDGGDAGAFVGAFGGRDDNQ